METDKASITLKGSAPGAAKVQLGSNTVNVGKDGKWSGTLALKGGTVVYTIVALDVAGNSATQEVTIKRTGVTDNVYGPA